MFNEPEWIKLLFLLADTQQWLNDMSKNLLLQLPVENKKKLFRKSYCITPVALAHIIERHYYKIPRHPQAGKFHISIVEIVQLLRDAADTPASPVAGTLNFQRSIQCSTNIGFDKEGQPTNAVTILSNPGGNIITAFPGNFTSREFQQQNQSCFHGTAKKSAV